MIHNYLKIAWRNLLKNRTYSIINIGGLAIGLTIAILIGLWVHDEITFNKHFNNYSEVGQVLINKTFDGETRTRYTLPYPLASELRNVYADDFKYVVMGSFPGDNILSIEEKDLTMFGVFMEEDALRMFSLNMLKGDKSALEDPNSIVLSESTAKELFGNKNPMGEAIKVNNANMQPSGGFLKIFLIIRIFLKPFLSNQDSKN